MSKDRPRFLAYVAVPTVVVGLCVALYFSGDGWPSAWVAPSAQRELGLLENLQNLVLVLAIVESLGAWRTESVPVARRLFAAIALGVFLVLMEELDWGDHYRRAVLGAPRSPDAAPFNLHNRAGLDDLLKRSGDVVLTLWLGVAPFCRLPARLRPWRASRWSAATLAIGFAASRLAHALEDAGRRGNGALEGNIGEFRETVTYWVVALYIGEVARRRGESSSAANLAPGLQATGVDPPP